MIEKSWIRAVVENRFFRDLFLNHERLSDMAQSVIEMTSIKPGTPVLFLYVACVYVLILSSSFEII